MVIECAFGRLKGRWGALRRAMDINLQDLPFVIVACFVLHNFCELNKETVSEEAVTKAREYDRMFQPPVEPYTNTSTNIETEGRRVRRVLTNYIDP